VGAPDIRPIPLACYQRNRYFDDLTRAVQPDIQLGAFSLIIVVQRLTPIASAASAYILRESAMQAGHTGFFQSATNFNPGEL
jgi:hypothetical protein